MTIDFSTPWHKASFDRFLQESLPQLLAERLPLSGYRAEPTGRYTCHVTVTLDSASGDVVCDFADLPYPDEDGIFEIDGERKVVISLAPTEELDVVEIACVGEQLYDHVAKRLGQAPQNGLPWDAELARAWLPLDEWIDEFMHDAQSAQVLEDTNWIARHIHLRSIFVMERKSATAPGQLGRVCPFETPEGSNTGRILRVAAGAQIRDGKLVIIDDTPQACLGLASSMIPFLEHDDPIHLLMGANMLRQQIVQSTPEPALVQTGNEPDAPNFWAGRNLLTALFPGASIPSPKGSSSVNRVPGALTHPTPSNRVTRWPIDTAPRASSAPSCRMARCPTCPMARRWSWCSTSTARACV